MKITKEKMGNIILFQLDGRLDSITSLDVEKNILDAIGEETKAIVLDFSLIDYLSSAGIRVLVHCHKVLEKKGGKIVLVKVNPSIENILYITGFLPYFKVYDTQAHALEDLGS